MNITDKINKENNKYLVACVIISVWLCIAQMMGNTLILLPCLLLFLVLVIWGTFNGRILPLLLYFLPWSPLIKIEQGTMSFYSVALILISMIVLIKNKFKINVYQMIVAIFLFGYTLLSRYAEGYLFDNSYILFILFLFSFPLIAKEVGRKYNIFYLVAFFNTGIILAALSAQKLIEYPNISKYIEIHESQSITRLSGYYEDPNFYSAHITATLAVVLLVFLYEKNTKRLIYLIISACLLVYCGLLSASKTFIVVVFATVLLWILFLLFRVGKISKKTSFLLIFVVLIMFILSSTVFSDLINVLILRFNENANLSTLTTGRTDIWGNYLEVFKENIKVLLFGRGFVNVLVDSSSSHNSMIQLVYQMGLFGTPAIILWIELLKRKAVIKKYRGNSLCLMVLLMGFFGPWLSLDMMFFDEFFIMPLFLFAVLNEVYALEYEYRQEKEVRGIKG